MVEPGWLEANWHAPRSVRAGTTTRLGGVSTGAYASLNLGDHVADDLTADCLPVVLASRDGARLGVAHAGWRGLAAGVIETTIKTLGIPPSELVAWLGPAIGATAFEVGGEVREAFVSHDADSAAAFTENARGRWQANLYSLAKRRLLLHGVTSVSSIEACTFIDTARFYSFRRHAVTGRMATLAWVEPHS